MKYNSFKLTSKEIDFPWLRKPQLSNLACTILDGTRINEDDGMRDFLDLCNSELKTLLHGYSLYLCILVPRGAHTERIFAHKGVWMYLSEQWDLSEYVLSEEIRVSDPEFFGVLKYSADDFYAIINKTRVRRLTQFILASKFDLIDTEHM